MSLAVENRGNLTLQPFPAAWSSDISRSDLEAVVQKVAAIAAPLWPLADYVAVNPFVGLADDTFLAARGKLVEARHCELLPSLQHFQTLFASRDILLSDLHHALQQVGEDYPDWLGDLELADLVEILQGNVNVEPVDERRVRTFAEIRDRQDAGDWTSHILNDMSRYLSAHYDQGQALWPSPWKQLPLFEAWRQAARISRRMDMLGLKGFRQLVTGLPADPLDAIYQMLKELQVPEALWQKFLLTQMLSVAGWASFVKNKPTQSASGDVSADDLTGLLAIRLAYDAGLAQRFSLPVSSAFSEQLWSATDPADQLVPPTKSVMVRYALQLAAEISYRRGLCNTLHSRPVAISAAQRKTAQMVFCIDVRSEVMRRHLEATTRSVETFGFAGFFGMPLEYVRFGETSGSAHCPVLLNPTFRVHECIDQASKEEHILAENRRRLARARRGIWKSFQSAAVSCFSFVESVGSLRLVRLVGDSLRWTGAGQRGKFDGLTISQSRGLQPDTVAPRDTGLSHAMKLQLTEGMLRNLGLTENFARLVILCGHAAKVTNNPYQAGLDCGACGGHSGEPNARVAAQLLNTMAIRDALRHKGIDIPADTYFLPAVHNTTTDEISFSDVAQLPASHQADLASVKFWAERAGLLCREERKSRLGEATADDLLRRSRDWAEVRPEWGLAGNAAFIIAPRWRTEGLDFQGRTFLHSYEPRNDPDGKVLELILTAPMVVSSWINLQYYASAVDNRAFGSGNKLIHNVVGKFGVFEGNGGDLMTGLPWQSVHDGQRLQHQPLRLQVIVEASRERVRQILEKHLAVRDLVSNGWISLIVLEGEEFYRWNSAHTWEECDAYRVLKPARHS